LRLGDQPTTLGPDAPVDRSIGQWQPLLEMVETVMAAPDTLELLIRLEDQLIDPATRHSHQALAELLSDDLLEFTASGAVYEKGPIIAALAAEGGGAWAEMTNYGYELRPLAEDVVLLTFRHAGKRDGGAEARSLRSSIWKLTGGRWRLVFHQGTPTTAD
jgi:hypothetical protein